MKFASNKSLVIFSLSALIAAALVMTIGWYTDFQQIMYTALITVMIFAFLPVLIIATGLAIILFIGVILPAIIGILAGLGNGDVPVDAMAEGTEAGVETIGRGFAFIPVYYRFLSQRNHPVFWGIPVGILLGGLLLWGLIGLIIIPGETETVRKLAESQSQIEQYYAEYEDYPLPDENGWLISAALSDSLDKIPVTDGFDRPLLYALTGKWKIKSYTITSLGFDGQPGQDDFCLSGATKAAKWVDSTSRFILDFMQSSEPGKSSVKLKLEAVKALRCEE